MSENIKTAEGDQKRQFGIEKIYTKDISLETPSSPQIFFTKNWNINANMELSNKARNIGNDYHEVVLTATVVAKNSDAVAYLIEVQQAGLFRIAGFDEKELAWTLGALAPNMLFPYLREAVHNLSIRCGFPEHILAQVNFDALFWKRFQEFRSKVAADKPEQGN